MNWFSLAQVQR